MTDPLTISEFIIQQQHESSFATGELSQILGAISLTAKIVNREINKAGLLDITGAVGTANSHGEAQQKLDLYANEKFKNALEARGHVCGLASEEDESFVVFSGKNNIASKYIVTVDPIDGSSNIDVNIPVGTIFSIYKRLSQETGDVNLGDFLQPGTQQVAAGYVIYGSSTMLVYSTGHGVNGFTFDPSIGTFYLSHENMTFPKQGNIYSINEGNEYQFFDQTKRYIHACKSGKNSVGKPYTSRYVGSLVADFHRNLLKGGIFLYPALKNSPDGKLRLLYECNPLAFLAEQAGGQAWDGTQRILDIRPASLHQRSPLVIGSRAMVEEALLFLNQQPLGKVSQF